jgi:hypothetical protein
MNSSDTEWPRLLEMFHEAGVGHLLSRHRDHVVNQLTEVARVYAEKLSDAPQGVLPKALMLEGLTDEHRRNPYRVAPVLQALAFNCSPEMLAMMWMVQQGASVHTIDYRFERGTCSTLDVSILLPDRNTMRSFHSNEHWDLAVLRLVGISKADGKPVIESFYALHIPPAEGYAKLQIDPWVARVLEWVQEYGSASFFCASLIDRRRIDDVASATVEAVRRGWLKPSAPRELQAVSQDPSAAPQAIAVLSGDAAMVVVLTPGGQRALRRTRFYRILAQASTHSLRMVRSELERVLDTSERTAHTPEEIDEFEDQLLAVKALLEDAS